MIESDRLISAAEAPMEDRIDRAIRPEKLADYTGQPAVCEQMEIFIKAARMRQDALDHTLIFGPRGWVKQLLANILANEMGLTFALLLARYWKRPETWRLCSPTWSPTIFSLLMRFTA